MILNKKILLIFFGLFFYLFLIKSFKQNQKLNNQFVELNNCDIYIEIGDNQQDKLNNLVEKLNQFDSFVTYSYIDNSIDLFLHNSLKNKSDDKLDIYTNMFKIPTLNNLFRSIEELSLDYIKENNKNIIDIFIDELFDFSVNENFNYNFSDHLLSYLVLDDVNINTHNRDLVKVVITSSIKFHSVKDKKNEYISFFNYINSLNKYNNNIKIIRFYNQFAYDCYNDFKKDNVMNIEPSYEPTAIFYENNLDSIYVLTETINKYSLNHNSTRSILDYMTDDTILGDKYKKIKNISIYSSAYEKIHNLPENNVDGMLLNLENLERNIANYGNVKNIELINKINFIYNFFEQNKNSYQLSILINGYNVNAPKFIRYIANTEPVDLGFVDPFIYDDYYNEQINKYAVKVNLKDNSYMIYKKFLFQNDNSLYLYVRIQILKIIFSLITILTFFIYMFKINNNKNDN